MSPLPFNSIVSLTVVPLPGIESTVCAPPSMRTRSANGGDDVLRQTRFRPVIEAILRLCGCNQTEDDKEESKGGRGAADEGASDGHSLEEDARTHHMVVR